MILPTGPATGNRTCILEKKRQQGFSGETALVVPRCVRDFGVSTRRWKIGVIRRIFPGPPPVQGWRRRIMHVERRTHARCLRGQLFPVVVKGENSTLGKSRARTSRPDRFVTIVPVTIVTIGIRNVTRFNIDNAKEDSSTLVWNNIKMYVKLIQFKPWKPAIHLDNRYRLMRHEPMLDADGNETDVIGKDDDC
ncbi:hypothetical protein ALC56_06092 [Trachymyrmex septentrionalis]|uniref:Uncharacterized protein n=1 Tax=Trachymyrmex septentrionalis TaxID=34720 RepID=A0A195FGT1_9HYME|nr:hypothetical protein ALC56_06092 [Trachymyrmex septentrionalis]